jgi:hypothetical protein
VWGGGGVGVWVGVWGGVGGAGGGGHLKPPFPLVRGANFRVALCLGHE